MNRQLPVGPEHGAWFGTFTRLRATSFLPPFLGGELHLSGVVLLFLLLVPAHGQSSAFEDLDFEFPTFVPVPSMYSGSVDAATALPGWTVFWGTSPVDLVLHDNMFLDSAGVSIWDTNNWGGFQGNFTVLIQGGFSLNSYPNRQSAAIAQTGLIPAWVNTLLFDARFTQPSETNFVVSIAGENLPFYTFASYTNYMVYELDVSRFSGQTQELRFTAYPYPPPGLAINPVYLDDIRFSSTAMQAQFSYAVNDGTVTITGFSGPAGDGIIPGTINGLPVTSIGTRAFYQCGTLLNVTIPNTVTNIGDSAFEGCVNLTGVTIFSVISRIGDRAFYGCTRLVDIALPSTVISIGVDAFHGCTSLTHLSIPSGLTNIADGSFAYCANLADIAIPSSVTSIGADAFEGCSSLTNATIPNSVTNIGGGAFAGTDLASVAIPNNLTSLGDAAFANCYRLPSITIPGSVTSIGNSTFSFCGSLSTVTIRDGVTSIGNQAFIFSGLNTITIPNTVTNIGAAAFYGTPLTSLSIPNSVTSIASETFGACALTSIVIPQSVTSIGASAFQYCYGLTSVTIPNSVISLGDWAFFRCTSLTSVTIPNSVTSIGNGAFNSCTNLARVTIGNSVTNIGWNAFLNCTNLTNVTIGTSVTSIGDQAFGACYGLTGVYFQGDAPSPGASVFSADNNVTVYYFPGTTGWGPTFAGLPSVLWNPQVQTKDTSFGVRSNQFGVNITGTANIPVVVEATTNLASPVWSPLQTMTLTNGAVYFSDPAWTNYPGRFYRLRSP